MGAMGAVNATDTVGVAADERDHLLAQGFSVEEAERLLAFKRRVGQRRPDGLSENHLRFVRWLVAQRRLHEGAPPGPGGLAAPASSA
jgi:hypothetical protein